MKILLKLLTSYFICAASAALAATGLKDLSLLGTNPVLSGGVFSIESGATFTYKAGASFAGDAAEFRTDIGLGAVQNYSAAELPISTATQAALDLKAPLASPAFTGTVTGITKAMVGLGNVDNTTDAGKPISTATQTALDGKQPLDSDLTAIAALTTTTFGRGVLAETSAATLKTTLALNNVANIDTTNAANIASGTLPAGRLPALTGDVTTTAGTATTTLATVNANTGSWGSATQAPVITLDGKGRATAASNVTITPAWTSVSGKPTTVGTSGLTDAVATARTISTTAPLSGGGDLTTNRTLVVSAATTSATGVVQLATTAQALAGTSTTLVVPVSANEARILNGDLNRANAPCLFSDGATANRGAIWTPGAAGALAGQPVILPFEFYVPTSNPATTAFLCGFSSSATSLDLDNTIKVYLSTAGALAIRQDGAFGVNYRRTDYTGFRAAYSGSWVRGAVVFSVGDSTTAPLIYINGVDVSASFSPAQVGSPPNWMGTSLDTTKFICGLTFSVGRFLPHAPILGALSAAEILEWTQTGRFPPWCEIGTGNATPSVSPSVLNGGFETAGAGGVDAFASWSEAASSGSTISRDTVVFNPNGTGAAAAKIVTDASNANAYFSQNLLSSGRKYRLEFWARSGGTAATEAVTVFFGTGSSSVLDQTLTTTWTKYSVEAVARGADLLLGRLFSGSAGQTIYVDDVTLTLLGPIFRPVIQPIATVGDWGANNLPGTLTAGITPIVASRIGERAALFGTFLHTDISATAGTTLLGSLPPGWAVVEVQANVTTGFDAGITLDVGTAASSARWASAMAITTTGLRSTPSLQLYPQSASSTNSVYLKKSGSTTAGAINVSVIIERKY